jgi:hypothetical protein
VHTLEPRTTFWPSKVGDLSRAFEIRNDRLVDASGCSAAFLHCGEGQRRFAALELSTSPQTSSSTLNPGLVNFHFAAQPLPLQVDHGPAEFVEHHPSCF